MTPNEKDSKILIIPKKKVTVQKDLKSASSSFKYPSMIEQ